MKLCTFEIATPLGQFARLGMLTAEGHILDLNAAYESLLAARIGRQRSRVLAEALVPPEMVSFIENGAMAKSAVEETLEFLGARREDKSLRGTRGQRLVWQAAEVRLLAPILRPRSLRDCLAFEEHLRNALGREPPKVWYEIPIYYKGNPNTVQGPEAEVPWPSYIRRLDYELEFAAVIAKEGVNLTPEQGWEHIFGYTIFNDVSARDLQFREMEGKLGPAKGKDLDGGNILGPFLVTADEWNPLEGHQMDARVNGERWGGGTTKAMHHDFGHIVSYISRDETLVPGDVIGSGTVGTGCGLELRKYPKPGDTIELEIEGLGVLKNRFGTSA